MNGNSCSFYPVKLKIVRVNNYQDVWVELINKAFKIVHLHTIGTMKISMKRLMQRRIRPWTYRNRQFWYVNCTQLLLRFHRIMNVIKMSTFSPKHHQLKSPPQLTKHVKNIERCLRRIVQILPTNRQSHPVKNPFVLLLFDLYRFGLIPSSLPLRIGTR